MGEVGFAVKNEGLALGKESLTLGNKGLATKKGDFVMGKEGNGRLFHNNLVSK